MWISVILELISVFGPMLVKWFREWLKHRMEETAKGLPKFSTFATDKDRHLALLRAVYESEPVSHVAKRRYVHQVIKLVESDKMHDKEALKALNPFASAAEQE